MHSRRSRVLPPHPRPRHAVRLQARVSGQPVPASVPTRKGASVVTAARIASALGARALTRAATPRDTQRLERRAGVVGRKRDLLRSAYSFGGAL